MGQIPEGPRAPWLGLGCLPQTWAQRRKEQRGKSFYGLHGNFFVFEVLPLFSGGGQLSTGRVVASCTLK